MVFVPYLFQFWLLSRIIFHVASFTNISFQLTACRWVRWKKVSADLPYNSLQACCIGGGRRIQQCNLLLKVWSKEPWGSLTLSGDPQAHHQWPPLAQPCTILCILCWGISNLSLGVERASEVKRFENHVYWVIKVKLSPKLCPADHDQL